MAGVDPDLLLTSMSIFPCHFSVLSPCFEYLSSTLAVSFYFDTEGTLEPEPGVCVPCAHGALLTNSKQCHNDQWECDRSSSSGCGIVVKWAVCICPHFHQPSRGLLMGVVNGRS